MPAGSWELVCRCNFNTPVPSNQKNQMNNSNLASVSSDHILTDHFRCFLIVQQIYHQVLFEPVTVLEVHPLMSV